MTDDHDPLHREAAAAAQTIRRLEAELGKARLACDEALQQLQQAQKMETLGTLVAGVAHEINNPLNLILYNLPLLRQVWSDLLPVLLDLGPSAGERKFGGLAIGFLKENLAQMLADTELAASRIAKTVADLKHYCRQSDAADRHPLNLNTAVQNALRLARATLKKAGISLRTELDEAIPEIEGDLPNIEQVVLNILVNAAQAIDHDHGEIVVRTGYSSKDGRARLEIEDNGRGVSPRIRERIFLPFVTDKQAQGGTGLGLSVSFRLVQAHGGEIRFEDRPGGGTVFIVSLPTAFNRRAPKILVVDDDPQVRQILREALLLNRAYRIEEASNGIEGSLRIGTYRPDLLILDVFMPEMDGLEVCRHLRNESALSGMQVIVTTGYPNHPKLAEIAALGFTHVIEKPFDIPRLLATVAALLPGG
jgi:signal transduction histidine kinase